MAEHQYDQTKVYKDGEHAWHYAAPAGTVGAIRVIRFGDRQVNVCTMDTLSGPNPERDVERICAALNAAEAAGG